MIIFNHLTKELSLQRYHVLHTYKGLGILKDFQTQCVGLACKGGLLSEGIFKLVPISKNLTASQLLTLR